MAPPFLSFAFLYHILRLFVKKRKASQTYINNLLQQYFDVYQILGRMSNIRCLTLTLSQSSVALNNQNI